MTKTVGNTNNEGRGLTAGDVLTPDALVAPDGLVPFASRKTVIRWAREGTIPSRKRAGKVYFIRCEIEEWLLGDTRGMESLSHRPGGHGR